MNALKQQVRRFSSSSAAMKTQSSLPASYYRGGTSRAIIFRQEDLPAKRSDWAPIFRGVIGSPDPNGRQLDGMGGGVSSLSKICVVGPSSHRDADVDYTFAAIGVKNDDVDYSSNCGNMTSAIGPFAIDSGLIRARKDESMKTVCIHNTNTGKLINATFPVVDGEAAATGDFAIDGVAGTAASIQSAFSNPAGSKTGRFSPTGRVVDTLDGIPTTCVDVGNPACFVQAEDLGVDGTILPDAIESHPDLLKRLDLIRRKACVAMGISNDEASAPGSIPKIAMVSKPKPHRSLSGQLVDDKSADSIVRGISVGQPHRAVPITMASALAAASKLEGSTVHVNTTRDAVDPDGVTIGHPSGRMSVSANFDDDGVPKDAVVFRTARRVMQGTVFWK